MFRNIIKIFTLLFMLTLLWSCAGTKKETKPSPETEKKPKMNESFDPLEIQEEGLKFKPREEEPDLSKTLEMPSAVDSAVVENHLTDGYRIQLLATKNIENANKAKYLAGEQFADLDTRVYLEFDSPLYKVRLGDFLSREAADQAKDVVRSRGYPKAFVAKSRVWTHPEIMSAPDSVQADTLEMQIDNNY